ncbi:MAG: TetR/AcrR family transcriptional regulator [Chloroflexi bacterium]|nr:TetR/AcrR family transcriptional regulator [Chloroflexota bacterium]
MNRSTSKSEINRLNGKHQVDEQRASILDAAEKLFLQNGLENTKMVDIAAQTGITKVTLYRYFPNRDVIALEIQARMMNKIGSLLDPGDQNGSLESTRKLAQSMIRNFDLLRDAYRYMGMFDKLYLDTSNAALTQWTKNQLISLPWSRVPSEDMVRKHPQGDRCIMIVSTVIWFLEKLALRGELTWSDQAVPLEEHLKLFEEMIMGYIDQFIATK